MSTLHNSPDPEGLAIAREIQDRLRPAEVILFGSRADGSHSPSSDVDIIAIAPDEDIAERTEETVNEIQQGRRGELEVTVITRTREEFQQWALLAQSFAGQAARYGVTPDGRSLDYRPEREPTPEEIRELTIWWLKMAQRHLNALKYYLENPRLADSWYQGLQAQWGLERSFKGLLAAENDTVRFRRDAALMWRHVESSVRHYRGPRGCRGHGEPAGRDHGPGRAGMLPCRVDRGTPAGRTGAGDQRAGMGGRAALPADSG